ncbi:MAG: hypothetical protein [Bacteriophage sp.]|nr:MAG: hypothetical protein [Bacteriophage sp.]
MTITYHPEMIQGSEEWVKIRQGLMTASEMKFVLTPTLKIADNDNTRSHVYELAAQRITDYTEPTYLGDEMLRGTVDEPIARQLYHDNFSPVTECGFITNDDHGFTVGYSPDGLVGDDGLIEVKGRRGKFTVQSIVDGEVPKEHMLQIQTGLLVTGRKWCDYLSFTGGMPLLPIRVYPDEAAHEAIIKACTAFETKIATVMNAYHERLLNAKWVMAERLIEADGEIVL